jgi:hypothetical protein
MGMSNRELPPPAIVLTNQLRILTGPKPIMAFRSILSPANSNMCIFKYVHFSVVVVSAGN